jgi:hypothetical protein
VNYVTKKNAVISLVVIAAIWPLIIVFGQLLGRRKDS